MNRLILIHFSMSILIFVLSSLVYADSIVSGGDDDEVSTTTSTANPSDPCDPVDQSITKKILGNGATDGDYIKTLKADAAIAAKAEQAQNSNPKVKQARAELAKAYDNATAGGGPPDPSAVYAKYIQPLSPEEQASVPSGLQVTQQLTDAANRAQQATWPAESAEFQVCADYHNASCAIRYFTAQMNINKCQALKNRNSAQAMQAKLKPFQTAFDQYNCDGRVSMDDCFPDGY